MGISFMMGVDAYFFCNRCYMDISFRSGVQWVFFLNRCPMDSSLIVGLLGYHSHDGRPEYRYIYTYTYTTKCSMDLSFIIGIPWMSFL